MSTRELRELSEEELKSRDKDLRQELFNLRFQHAARQLESTARITHTRREIARVATILRERELTRS